MFLSKFKTGALLLVAALMIGAGFILAAQRPAPSTEPPPAAAQDEEKQPPKERTTLVLGTDWPLPLALSPNGKILAVAGPRTIRLWDIASGKAVRTLESKCRDLNYAWLVFSPDGKRVSAATQMDGAETWDATTGKRLGSVSWPNKPDPDTGEKSSVLVLAGTASANGRRAAFLSNDGKATVYDLESGKRLSVIEVGKERRGQAVGLSPDGKTLAVMAGLRPKLWEADTGKGLKAEPASGDFEGQVIDLRFSADGKSLLGVTYGGVKAWRVDGRAMAFVATPLGAGKAAAISADGRTVAVGRTRAKLAIYEMTTGKTVEEFRWVSDPASVALSSDGSTLASLREGRVRVWDLRSSKKK